MKSGGMVVIYIYMYPVDILGKKTFRRKGGSKGTQRYKIKPRPHAPTEKDHTN